MKLNPRELAEKLSAYRFDHGAKPDPMGYGIGDRIGAAMREIATDHQSPEGKTTTQRRRLKAIYEMHMRNIYGQLICQIILYGFDNQVYVSFEQAESYVVGRKDDFVHELMGSLLEVYASLWRNMKTQRDEDHSVVFRVLSQRMLNYTFAIIANSNLGDPIIDVLDPYLNNNILNEPTYSRSKEDGSVRGS